MRLIEIETINELIEFVPHLIKIKNEDKNKWEPNLSQKDFLLKLFHDFGSNQYFGEIKDDKLVYFATLERTRPTTFCWLFYVSPKHPELTTPIINELKRILKETGGNRAFLTTGRLTRSYERWMSKNGFVVDSINYVLTL